MKDMNIKCMGGLMNVTSLKIGLCALLAITSFAANASVKWDFTQSGSLSGTATGSYTSTGINTSTGGTASTTLTAWSAPVLSKVITNSNGLLGRNSYGLLIDQDGSGGGDSHAIDNGGNYEFVMFDFGIKKFSLEAFDIGWDGGDSDVTVMAYQGSQPAGDIGGASLTGLSGNGWNVISHHSDTRTVNTGKVTVSANSNLDGVYSSYWIIGAYMSAVGPGGQTIGDISWDAIKLAGITGSMRSTPPPTGDVPEPGTLLLTALGLAFIARKKMATKS